MKTRALPYLFMLPALSLMFFVFAGPLLGCIFLSMTDWDGISRQINFVGLANFSRILRHEYIGVVFLNHLKLLVLLVFLQNMLALLVALLLNQDYSAKHFFRAVIFLPTIIASVAIGFIWSLIYDPFVGPIATIATKLGLKSLASIQWLGNPDLALYSVAFVQIWQWVGWYMAIYLAGLQTIPRELFESAEIDGASRVQRLRRITLPMLAPAITINMIMTTIAALRIFDLPYILTKGGPGHYTETFSMVIFNYCFLLNDMGYGSAFSLLLLVMILVVAVFEMRYFRKGEESIAQ